MAVVLRSCTRSFLKNYNQTFLSRKIMTSSSRAKEFVEELKEKNPYYEKYAEKIAKLQQTSPEDFLSKIEAQEKVKNKPKFGGIKERQYSSLLKPKDAPKSTEGSDRSLNDIMKLDLIQDKNSDEIKQIWEEYHKQKEVISAIIPKENYEKILERSLKYPIFLFPLPRTEGYEFFVCQFLRNTVHFTPLICYQVHKENSPECLTMVHYTEFKDDKKIVLMRGEYDKDVLDCKEAQCLANQLQMYYGQQNEKKLRLLETFTSKPDEFKHMELISELENLSLK